jgi:hypothetical protein
LRAQTFGYGLPIDRPQGLIGTPQQHLRMIVTKFCRNERGQHRRNGEPKILLAQARQALPHFGGPLAHGGNSCLLERASYIIVDSLWRLPMSRIVAYVLAVLGGMYVQGQACAQLTPPAGSAGAGSSAVNGVPFGPANPRVLSDPSGIGNASSLPPLRSNTPAPTVTSIPLSSTRVVVPPYPSASEQIIST